mgnify:CR=1 FL=1
MPNILDTLDVIQNLETIYENDRAVQVALKMNSRFQNLDS